MNSNGRKISSKLLLTLIFTAIFFSVTLNSPANYSSFSRFCKILALGQDTSKPRVRHPKNNKNPSITTDTVRPGAILHAGDTLRRDSLGHLIDSTRDSLHRTEDTLDYKISKDTMEAAIDYKATDSVVMNVPSKRITLYNKANTKYKDADLSAYEIEFDQSRNVVVAMYTKDTAGNIVGLPKMVQQDKIGRAHV